MATIGERLRLLREKRGYATAKDAARAFGWNENTYRSHENGYRHPPRKWLLTYASVYGVTVTWLLRGVEDGARARSPDGQIIPILHLGDLPKRRADMHTALRQATRGQIVMPDRVGSEDTLALPVWDRSMVAPAGDPQSLYPDDIALFDVKAKVQPGKLCLIYDPDHGEHLIRKAQAASAETWRFVPLNPDYRAVELDAKSPHILAVIVRIIRSL